MSQGTLFLVATPIGNVEDFSPRAKRMMESADLVACEDTRRTGLLLHRLGIKKTLTSFHDHSGRSKLEFVLRELADGKQVVLVSDGGTPLISDPGFPLVREAIAKGIRIEAIPGPCALVQALIVSGFSCEPFVFYGFLPQKDNKRKTLLLEASREKKTIIFYESPYRMLKTLRDMAEIFGERRIAVARELTKKFEEVLRGSAAELLPHVEKNPPRGEFVVVVEGSGKLSLRVPTFQCFTGTEERSNLNSGLLRHPSDSSQ